MATAELRTTTMTVNKTVVVPETVTVNEGVTLQLSHREASTLAAILNRIGGDPADSPRGHTDDIKRALKDVGYDAERVEETNLIDEQSGRAIYFRSYNYLEH